MRPAFGVAALALLPFLAIAGHEKVSDPGHAENALVSVNASALTDNDSIKNLLGSDLGGFYTVVQVTVTPKSGKLNIQHDDFLLRTDKDGERTHPLEASEIAGPGGLTLHAVRVGGGGAMGQNNGPVWGGAPGTGGMPMQLPGNGGYGGNGAGGSATVAKVDKNKAKADPMLPVLKEKILPEREADGPVSGVLIFNLEKQKLKDLELIYTTTSGPLRIRFR